MSAAKALVVEAVKRHTSTVIVAHGLGDSGAGWYFLAEEFRRKSLFPETKFVFPNAPNIPITVNGGMSMPGWYDIADFGDLANRSEDEAGILRSQKVFHTLIEDEIKAGIPTERIVLGGFSQGGAMSLMAGITNPTKLGGIFGLSCYLLLQGKVRELVPKDSPNQQTPIFMGHGDADPVVRYAWGKATADKLKDWGWNVTFNTYKGLPHSAAPQEIEDLAQYLQKQIPDLGDKAAGGSL
ncbi:Acyl-protein thioesterase 1 [Pseudocercospora fuligena]|uniref:Acyl-protein thioesterase 1 n=1 Tax=Pseudocercospora fuligena TaxID=685502 RepID=A0A8H6RUM7_9PEZI|nr:Acyl-protein thioesterase 1 [Pseudocercospora fuligena]